MDFPDNEAFYLPIYTIDTKFIEIPNRVKSIPEYHFEDHDRFIYIYIYIYSNTIKYIGNYALKGYSSLTMVYSPKGL